MASTKINTAVIINKLNALRQLASRYLLVIFIVLLIGMYSFLVVRINSLISAEPSSDEVSAQLQNVQRPKIDQSAIVKIQQLQDNSTEVQTLFKATRDNPFQE